MVAVVALAVAGCGSDKAAGPASSAASGSTVASIGGAFGDVPSPGQLTPLSEPNKTASTVSQGFEVDGMDAESTFQFYEQQLPAAGWTKLEAGPSGSDFRGVWKKDETELTVTVGPLGSKPGTNCQLSLQAST